MPTTDHAKIHQPLLQHVRNAFLIATENMAGVLCLEDLVEDEGSKFPDVVFRPQTPQKFSSNYIIWRKNQVFSRAARIVLAGFEAAFGEESDVNLYCLLSIMIYIK